MQAAASEGGGREARRRRGSDRPEEAPARPSAPLRVAVGLLSAGAVAYELLLIRLLSIVQWHHFAFMVISLALLGYGASGALLTVLRGPLLRRFGAVFAVSAAGFGVLSVVCVAVAQRLPFNPLELAWSPAQVARLAALYLLLAVPFLCAATAIGLSLARFGDQADRVYRADLIGAGAGALLAVLALWVLPVERALLLAAAAGLAATAVAALDRRLGLTPGLRKVAVTAAVLLVVGLLAGLAGLTPPEWLEPRLSEFKGLARALRVPGAEVVAERSSPLARLTVVRSPRVPFRHAPGLSFLTPREPPEQLGLFTDGDAMTAIHRLSGDPGELVFLDYLPEALGYRLVESPRVALIGLGGGSAVLGALHHGASRVLVSEPDPQRVRLLREVAAGPADRGADAPDGRPTGSPADPSADPLEGELADPLSDPRVEVAVGEGRGVLAAASGAFDLIVLGVPPAAGGGLAAAEGYRYTVEALGDYLAALRPEGYLMLSGPLSVPPRASLRLLATAGEALERAGSARPAEQVAMVRSWDAFVLLVKRGRIGPGEAESVRTFCAERAFDVAWYPAMPAGEANQRHRLDRPYLHEAARALLGDRAERRAFVDRYKLRIDPATDDRPYFGDFFKWRTLGELLRLPARGGASLVEWGHLLLLATLVQAALAGALLIVLPVALFARRTVRAPGTARVTLYFLALGLAFLFLEIAFIQRLTLFLADPLRAATVVLGSFLVFAGVGSGLSRRWRRRHGARAAVVRATIGIAALAVVYLVALPPLLGASMGLPVEAKVPIALLLLAPLALLMGMPFPLGLELFGRRRPEHLPWAWAVNGWGSVLSAVLATVVAMQAGFSAVVLCAVALYALAVLVLPSPRRTGGGR